MSVTSANLTDLTTFVNRSGRRLGRLSNDLEAAANKASAVMAASSFNHPSTPSLQALGELLTAWIENTQYVQVIHDELLKADQYDADGNPIVANTVIDAALKARGLDDAPDLVEVDEIVMYGQPPYSGWVDDPINLANGNFLLRDGDLLGSGVARAIAVVRTYSSRDRGIGAFGPGWSSVLDAGLALEEQRVTYRGIDGGGAVFRRLADGGWSHDHRRDLTLEEAADGWLVLEGHDRTWRFDADGVLRSYRAGQAEVVLERRSGSILVREGTSGRSVTYQLDTAGQVVSAETSDGRSASYERDAEGRVVAVRRPLGDVTYEYDEHGFLAAVVDADGIAICRNEYDPEGRVLSQVEHHGRRTTYEYRADGVSTVTAEDGAPPNVMVHDRRGRMTAMFDGLGNVMRVAYDDRDDVVQVVARSGAVTRLAYDERGNVVERIDPDGLVSTFTWDDDDRLLEVTDRAGGSTRFEYEGELRSPARIAQPNGGVIAVAYDKRELPTSVTDADGVTTELAWTPDGRVAWAEGGDGTRIEIRYDAAGRPVAAEGPSGPLELTLDEGGHVLARSTADRRETWAYTAAGRLVGGEDARGRSWQLELDEAGEIQQVMDELGPVASLQRDTVGRIVAMTGAAGATRRFEHDPLGRVTAVIEATGGRRELGYDPDGRLVQISDPTGATWSEDLDALGRPTMSVDPAGATWVRSYHPNGELASVSDPAGRQWTYEVDAAGRVVAATDPLGATTTYRWSLAGRLLEVRSPLGRVQRRQYDEAGRLVAIVHPDGREEPVGEATLTAKVAQRRLAGARTTQDERGRITQVVDPAGVVTDLAYDAAGHLVAQTTAGCTTRFDRDEAGRLVGITDPYGRTATLGRDARGHIDRIDRPDGTSTARTFGPDGRLLAAHDGDGTPLVELRHDERGEIVGARGPGGSALAIGRDALGRTTEVVTDAGATRYAWDADGYLSAVRDDALEVTLDWSQGGALLGFAAGGRQVPLPGPVAAERDDQDRVVVDEDGRRYAYDEAGRLVAVTVDGRTTTYGYDELGLLASEDGPEGRRTYQYGRAGELTSLQRSDGVEVRFEHDATGRRTREVASDGSQVAYAWDELGRLVSVTRTEASGATHVDTVRQDPVGRPSEVNGIPILWDYGTSGVLRGVGDERYLRWGGQVLVATAPGAGWSRRLTDDPWGDDGGSGVRAGYRGELALDGLLFLGARVYDTRTRTFLSPDPLPPVPGALTFAGVYSYAWNDPVNLVDPSGRRPLSDQDYEAWVAANTKGFAREWGESIADDPWGFAAKVAIMAGSAVVMALAVATLGPVGVIVAGAVVGAVSGGLNAAIDNEDPDKLGEEIFWGSLIGGVSGAATSGLSQIPGVNQWANSAGRQALLTAGTEYPAAFGQEAANTFRPGGDDEMDWGKAFMDGTFGTVGGVGLTHFETRAWDALGPDLDGLQISGETPSSLLPDPAGRTVFDINSAGSADLQRLHGIGPVTADAIIQARQASGGFDSVHDLLDVKGIGPKKLQSIIDAGVVAH